MRVLVLGPVVSKNTSGGVAVFDEGLYGGFVELGDDVQIISIEKSLKVDNIVIKSKNPKPKKIIFYFNKIAKEIKKFQPDLVISSLHYSLGIKKYKRAWPSARYIQVLHGFPCQINGLKKAAEINYVARFSRKHFDFVVTVSFLSYAINKKINRIICDKVIHNGCALVPSDEEFDRTYDFVYVGRLFRDKEVEMIGDAFKELKKNNPDMRLAVAGFGELKPLFSEGKFHNCGIEYLGKLTQPEVRDLLNKTKFFISMNPLEPFGTVFNEAVMNGCNIVTQSTTGSAALFIGKKYFHIADCISGEELEIRLEQIANDFSPIPLEEKKRFVDYMSFKRAATEYKELAWKIKK